MTPPENKLPLSFHSLPSIDPDAIAQFCAGAEDPEWLRADLAACFADRSLRPEWCWRATDSDGRTVALLYWWAKPDQAVPHVLFCLSPCPPDPGAALVEHSRTQLGLTEADAGVVIRGAAGTVERDRPDRAALLAATGFRPEVQRVRLEWTPAAGVPESNGALRFVPAGTLADDALLALFAAVGDGSLDNTSIRRRAGAGRDAEAAERLSEARGYHGPDDWFAVGLTGEGRLAGYVVSALVDQDRPILAELGVAQPYRGNGYAGELLAHGTRLLADWGAERIRSDTDQRNAPMRAAFARAGYREFAQRFDYRWIR